MWIRHVAEIHAIARGSLTGAVLRYAKEVPRCSPDPTELPLRRTVEWVIGEPAGWRFELKSTAMNSGTRLLSPLIALIALIAVSAFAQSPAPTPAPALNLGVPADADPLGLANDPPGTYYGDVGGKEKDGSGVQVSGAFSTTIGYAQGYGSGISNSAELDVVKNGDDGQTFSLHLHVTEGDALPYRGRYYRDHW
jgi:hypothetical protein